MVGGPPGAKTECEPIGGWEKKLKAQRWALGERSIPPTVAIVLRLLVSGKVEATDIRRAHDR